MKALSIPEKLGATKSVDDQRLILAPRKEWTLAGTEDNLDILAVEEPLEIRLGGAPLAVVMRTPGHDEELAFGFALTEGLVAHGGELLRAVHCSQGEHGDNVISLIPKPSVSIDPRKFQRNFYTTSSCGICGKQSMQQALRLAPPIESPTSFSVDVLRLAPAKLTEQQEAYAHCGALHGAGLLNTDGQILCVREDIGRHNAVDKVVGWAAKNQTDLSSLALVISGRASFEIIQKALFARLSCVVAVGGASSLAVELAKKSKITLIGFARETRVSIYSGMETVV